MARPWRGRCWRWGIPALAEGAGLPVPKGGFIGLRPEDIQLRPAGEGQLQGTVALVEALGAETLIHVATATGAKVIAYDRLITNTPDLDYYVAFDNFKVGAQQATSLLAEKWAAAIS